MKIDAHQQFWKYSKTSYRWISDEMASLRKDFLPKEFHPLLKDNGIDGCIAVLARHSEKENDFLLKIARENDWIKGVVGWVDLCDAHVDERLAHFAKNPKLKGVGHRLLDEEDQGFMLQKRFNVGVASLKYHKLAFDLFISNAQVESAIEFVRRHPYTNIVLDHLTQAPSDAKFLESWSAGIEKLATCENLHCKLTGLIPQVGPNNWSGQEIQPYIDKVLEVFGPERLMFGSDWPVLTQTGTYAQHLNMVMSAVAKLSETEQAEIMGLNAERFYRL